MVSDMKNITRISDDALSLIWGGYEMHPELNPCDWVIDNRNSHGKTQPGNNEDIFKPDYH